MLKHHYIQNFPTFFTHFRSGPTNMKFVSHPPSLSIQVKKDALHKFYTGDIYLCIIVEFSGNKFN